jgi:hypothetical protein
MACDVRSQRVDGREVVEKLADGNFYSEAVFDGADGVHHDNRISTHLKERRVGVNFVRPHVKQLGDDAA